MIRLYGSTIWFDYTSDYMSNYMERLLERLIWFDSFYTRVATTSSRDCGSRSMTGISGRV